MFYDMAGDGYRHRTAWAGTGDGVLVIDARAGWHWATEGARKKRDGEISERNEVIFGDWDPSADSDMAAIRNVFDSNGNGKLDAGDVRWSQFRIMVSNADGTTSVRTLAELGIQSINLIADQTQHHAARRQHHHRTIDVHAHEWHHRHCGGRDVDVRPPRPCEAWLTAVRLSSYGQRAWH